jgi:GDP-D-mannose 3',5'-epimerase
VQTIGKETVGASYKIVVTGAGGFIGGALVAELRRGNRNNLRAVDIKHFNEWYQCFPDVENLSLDLNLKENCEAAAKGASDIYNLACNMGGWDLSKIIKGYACCQC